MRQSDEDRFTAFVDANSATLFRTAYLMCGDYQRAEDLLQTTLVRVYQHWTRIEAMDRPVAYTRKMLVNQSTSWWRRRSSHEAPVLVRDDRSWDGHVDDIAEHERVWAAVLEPPPKAASGDVLKYYEDLSEAEIAATWTWRPAPSRATATQPLARWPGCSPSPPICPPCPPDRYKRSPHEPRPETERRGPPRRGGGRAARGPPRRRPLAGSREPASQGRPHGGCGDRRGGPRRHPAVCGRS